MSDPTPHSSHPDEPVRAVGHVRRLPLVAGILLALVGLPLLLGGAGLAWAITTQRDDDGFFTTPTESLTTETVALSSTVVELGEASADGWWTSSDAATVRLSAESGESLFVGIARSADLERYLGSASYDEITDLRTDPFAYALVRRGAGGTLGSPPVDQRFWTAEATGTGRQTLEWDLEPGTYTAVVMNADGSAGVEAELSVAGRLTFLTPLAWALGLTGTLLIVGGSLLVVYGAHASSRSAPPLARAAETDSSLISGASGAVTSPVRLTGHQETRLSRWLWLVKWILAIPHFLVLSVLWLAFVVVTVVAFFSILLTGQYPRGLFAFNVGVLRWTWRVQFYATSALGTDRYPPFTLGPAGYPADLDIDHPARLSRGLVLVKSWLLALPHLIVLAVLAGTWQIGDAEGARFTIGGLVGALALAAGLLLLFTGRYPRPLFDLLIGLNRWAYRVIAYVALMTDSYPPFRLDQGPTEPEPPSEPPDNQGGDDVHVRQQEAV